LIVPDGTRQSKKLIVNYLVSDYFRMSILTETFMVKVAKFETLPFRSTVTSRPFVETKGDVFSKVLIVALIVYVRVPHAGLVDAIVTG
jgi:hypothetical protein